VLEELDLIEVEASARIGSGPASSSLSVLVSGSAVPVQAPISTSISQPVHERDIIIIDSEEDDKENVPVPTRHVRRRTQQQPRSRAVVDVDDVDVIDISSSD